MKVRFKNCRDSAMTIIELLAILFCLFLLAAIIVPVLQHAKARAQRLNCVSNLKQDALAARIWEGDNSNLYPMQVSITNGGGRELIAMGNVAGLFAVMSNELSTSRILICPADTQVVWPTNSGYAPWATGFGGNYGNKTISYFAGVDVTNENDPRKILFGDDNLEINGAPVPSSVAEISTNASITWGGGRHDDLEFLVRHHYCGNIGFADGSVQEVSQSGLQQVLIQTGQATNRWAIP
jgi:prepilin-type processing-associated H-X9-DG protein